MEVYNSAIIGLGFIGAADQVSGDVLGQQVSNLDGTHIDAYNRNERIRVVGGSSRDEGRRQRFAERFGADTFSDWRELLAAIKPDIVSVATYTPVHKEITLACARAGVKAVYCEKPIANTVEDAYEMVETCRDNGTLLVINHNRRFHPMYRALRDQLAEGAIGDIQSAHLRWGSGRLGNVGTHLFDALCMITGGEPVAVSGALDDAGKPDCRGPEFSDPGGWGMIRFAGGWTASVCAPDYGRHPMLIEVAGSLGTLLIEGREARYVMVGGASAPEAPASDFEGSSMDIAAAEIVEQLDTGSPYDDFPCDAADAAKTLEIIAGFHASHRGNAAWVKLPLAGDNRRIVVNSG